MHILFKGEDPYLLTHPVYEGAVAEDDDAALRRKQKVTPTDVEEKSFKSLTFVDIGNLTQRGALYKDGERNPNQLCNQLLFFCGVADAVLFLGKPHAQVVWSLLQQGRQVLAVDRDTTQLEYTVQYVTHEVSSKAYPCDFHHVVVEPVYDSNKDMFFKLTPKKRRQVYSFLYGEQPRLRFDPQYVVRKEVAIAVLQGYHEASRAGAVSFIKRLEYVFFNEDVVDPTDFTLDKYKLAFGEEDDFNIETEQEESVQDDLFDLDEELTIFNAQISESPSVCKPGTPLATPTSGGPTPVSSSAPVKRGGLSRLRSSPGEPIRLTPQPSNKWLEVSSAFYALPSSPLITQVSWELPGVTPPAGVVKRKSRGKDDDGDGEGGGQRGTGGGSDSPVKAVMSASLETAGARMNPSQGPVNISLPDASLETTVIRIHPRHTDEGLQLAGVEGCRLLTTLDKDNSADERIDLTLKDVGMELPVQPGYDDPLYSALHNEATGEDDLKKASDAVGDRFLYLSDDDKDTAYGDKKLRGGEVLLDIHGTLSPTQYDTVAMEKTQPADVVDVDDLCPETNIPSTVIDADISSLLSFPVGLEHVVASSTHAGVPIVLGLPSVGSGEVVARPGKH
ncbi:hypothetical protein CBR_g19200 [Chara braunii]|uniref:Uncharacterized protein n=1 Tax=Chara braunii TaxID=69332 RepID=A0A388JTN9_CHABU|nr:hypothetical protein CBR_g19200 [Chara braunii]|eukprot:GBG61123.1 hypothetical protein CBR_g19200 [Chara braunii]